MLRISLVLLSLVLGWACEVLRVQPAAAQATAVRAACWIDALRGEPLTVDEVLDDLQQSAVIYIGEYHTIARHHELQRQLLQAMAARGKHLVLAMEQFESSCQPALDRFHAGTLDLDGLVRETHLDKRWPGHTNYHAILREAARLHVPILALNARPETIRTVGQRGLAGLSAEQRRELPQEIVTDDPPYERLLNRLLGVHMAFDPNKLRPVFEAQVARDETMAARLVDFIKSPAGQNRTALVICGRGHCEFGMGTTARVARRIPGISQRILLFSDSGDLKLTEQERKQARDIEVPHEFLREIGRPPGDYFHVIEPE